MSALDHLWTLLSGRFNRRRAATSGTGTMRLSESRHLIAALIKRSFKACFAMSTIVTSGCSEKSTIDSDTTAAWVRSAVHVGDSLTTAITMLKGADFSCSDITEQLHPTERGAGRTYSCRRNVKAAGAIFDRFVGVTLRDLKVTDIVDEIYVFTVTDSL